jgi:hypothetical protein
MVLLSQFKAMYSWFFTSKANTSLFLFHKSGITMFILIYVDDIIVTRSSNSAISVLLLKLSHEFALTDLGDLHFFLGIEVHKKSNGPLLNQHINMLMISWQELVWLNARLALHLYPLLIVCLLWMDLFLVLRTSLDIGALLLLFNTWHSPYLTYLFSKWGISISACSYHHSLDYSKRILRNIHGT